MRYDRPMLLSFDACLSQGECFAGDSNNDGQMCHSGGIADGASCIAHGSGAVCVDCRCAHGDSVDAHSCLLGTDGYGLAACALGGGVRCTFGAGNF